MRLSVLALFLPAVLAAQGIPAVSRNTAGAPPAAQPAAPPTKPEDLCKLSGRVLNAVTGEPVRRTTIMLMRADPTPGEPPLAYTTASNAEGQFTMKDVEPGRYRLTATRNGFVNLIYGARGPMRPGTTLSLARQQNLTDLDLKMTPHAVITGRILDEDGEPLANVPLVLQSYRYVQGSKQLATAGAGSSSNDLGEYRMFGIAPGKYLLSAAAVNRAPNFAVDRSAVAGPEEDYVSTYYPGTIAPAGATQIDVAPGAQLRGMNMTLSKAHTVRVKGRVTHGLPGRPNITVVIASRNNTFMMGGIAIHASTRPVPSRFTASRPAHTRSRPW